MSFSEPDAVGSNTYMADDLEQQTRSQHGVSQTIDPQRRPELNHEPAFQFSDNIRTSTPAPIYNPHSTLPPPILTPQLNISPSRIQTIHQHVQYTLPDQFSGSGDLDRWIAHFDIISELNNWDERERVKYLCSALRGDALDAIKHLSPREKSSCYEIIKKLRSELTSTQPVQSYRLRLRRRKRKEGEALVSLSRDIRRLALKSYPGAPMHFIDEIAIDHFVESLNDTNLRLQIRRGNPRSLTEALSIAQFEEGLLQVDEDRNPLGRRCGAVQGNIEPLLSYTDRPTYNTDRSTYNDYDRPTYNDYDRPTYPDNSYDSRVYSPRPGPYVDSVSPGNSTYSNYRPSYTDSSHDRPSDRRSNDYDRASYTDDRCPDRPSPCSSSIKTNLSDSSKDDEWKSDIESKLNALLNVTKDLSNRCNITDEVNRHNKVHFAPRSPSPRSNNRVRFQRRPLAEVECYGCHEYGHYKNNCPRFNSSSQPNRPNSTNYERPSYTNGSGTAQFRHTPTPSTHMITPQDVYHPYPMYSMPTHSMPTHSMPMPSSSSNTHSMPSSSSNTHSMPSSSSNTHSMPSSSTHSMSNVQSMPSSNTHPMYNVQYMPSTSSNIHSMPNLNG